MNDLLAKIPLEGWKSLAGALVCIAAGVGLWTKLATFEQAAGMFAAGVGLLGIGLKAASARIEKKVEATAALAAEGTAAATVAAVKADQAADAAAGTAAAQKEVRS